MTLNGFLERDTSALHKDVAFGLTQFELHLCHHFSRVELRVKRGRKVAVLLSPDMVKAITRLIEKRKDWCSGRKPVLVCQTSLSDYLQRTGLFEAL